MVPLHHQSSTYRGKWKTFCFFHDWFLKYSSTVSDPMWNERGKSVHVRRQQCHNNQFCKFKCFWGVIFLAETLFPPVGVRWLTVKQCVCWKEKTHCLTEHDETAIKLQFLTKPSRSGRFCDGLCRACNFCSIEPFSYCAGENDNAANDFFLWNRKMNATRSQQQQRGDADGLMPLI